MSDDHLLMMLKFARYLQAAGRPLMKGYQWVDAKSGGNGKSVALALLPIASTLSDTIMQHLFSERRHYREYKTEVTPDFSDVRAKVEQLEKQSMTRKGKEESYA